MKNAVLLMLLAVAIHACQEKTTKDTPSENAVPTQSESLEKAEIKYESDPVAQKYRTVITEKYRELDVNFASYYVITTWGCGSGCVSGAMVDTRDGSVYPMPEDEEWGGNGTYIDSKKESDTLLTVLAIRTPSGEIEETRKHWQWNEGLKNFELVKMDTLLVAGDE